MFRTHVNPFAILAAALGAALAQAQICPEEIGKLLASDGAEQDEFGSSVAVSGDAVVVGAPEDAAATAGSAPRPFGAKRHSGLSIRDRTRSVA